LGSPRVWGCEVNTHRRSATPANVARVLAAVGDVWTDLHAIRRAAAWSVNHDKMLQTVKALVRDGVLEESGGNDGVGTYIVRRKPGGAA